MFISYSNFFLARNNSIKKQKLVGKVTKQLGMEGEGGSGGGGGESDDGSGSKSKQNGLVKVRLRDIHDGWPEDALPNHQMKGGFGSGNAEGTTDATKQIPPVGAKVYGEYENDSQYHPVYHGGSASEDKKNPAFTGENYGKTYGHADTGGNLHRVGTEKDKEFIERTHKSGSGDMFDKDGNYSNKVSGGHTFEGQKDGVFKYKGKLVFEADQIEFKHKGAKTSMPIQPGGGSPSSPSAPKSRNRPTYAKPGMSV